MKTKILDRYILTNHVGPYFFALSVITFVFVMDFIIRWIGKFIANGVKPPVVLEFFILSLGHMFALIIPMAVMPATLMAFGQLASENEVIAMRSSGISLHRMLRPVVAAALVMGIGMIFYNDMLLPESNHRLANLMIDIGRMKPTLEIRENIFNDAIDGYTILVREKNDRTGAIGGVQIYERKGAAPKTIIAEGGRMSYNEEDKVLRFELEDGEIHEMPDPGDIKTYRLTRFKHFTMNLQDAGRDLRRTDRTHRSDREMSAGMMRARAREYETTAASTRAQMHQLARDHLVSVLSRVAPAVSELAPLPAPGAATPAATPTAGERSGAIPRAASESERILQMLTVKTYELDGVLDQISRYGVEIHKKYAIPMSCIIFLLLGAPLAIRSGKGGMTMAIGFSIFFFLIYYVFLISGEKLADRRFVEPWLSMWIANILLAAVAIALIRRTNREYGAIDWGRYIPLKRWRRAHP
jgi:lipopolysaccharide export system permease protein